MSETATIGRAVLQVEVDGTGAQAQLDTTSRSIDAIIKRIQQQAANVGKTTAEIKLQELAQRGATQAQLDAYAAANRTVEAYRQQQVEARKAAEAAAAAARQQAAAAHLASGSLNTVQLAETTHALRSTIEMIASGQNPLRALATEGFRFSSIMGGVTQAFQALSSIFTTTRVLAGGLLSVLAGVGYVLYEGAQQSREFNEALIKTGNYAGQTSHSFTDMARNVAEATSSSVGSIRDFGTALLQSGEIPQAAFAKAVEAAANYARITGKTAEETAKDFVSMAEDPVKFALAVSKSMSLITSDQYKAIKSYQDHGEKVKALDVLYSALGGRADKLRESQSWLGRTLDAVKVQWSEFWDAAYDVTRESNAIPRRIQYLNTLLNNPDIQKNQPRRIAILSAEKTGLQMQQQAEDAAAQEAADNAALNKRAIAGQQLIDDYAKRGKAVSVYKTKLDELNKAIADNAKAGTPIPAADIAAAKKGIYEQFGDKGAVTDAKAKAAEQAAAVKASYEQQIKDQQNALSVLEAQRSAGLVDEQDYFDQKAQFIEKDKNLTVASLEAQRKKYQDLAGKLKDKDASDNARTIIGLTTQISDAQKKAATQETILAIQRQQASRAVTAAYQAELAAAKNLLDAQNRNQSRAVRAVGLGDEERNRLSQRDALQDGFAAQRIQAEQAKSQLETLGKFTATQRQMYADKLSVITEYEQKSLESFDRSQEEMKAAQADALNGASRAVQNYMDQAQKVADQTASLVTDVFTGLEDVLAETLATGKGNWKSFFTTIQTDINKMAIKGAFSQLFDMAKGGSFGDTISGIATALGGATGGAKMNPAMLAQNAAIDANTIALDTNNISLSAFEIAIGSATEALALMAANSAGQAGGDALGAFIDAMGAGHAVGGPVSAGKLYPVNEKGPELLNVAGKQYLMMGANDGNITPNGAYGKAANSTTIIVNVTPPQGASRETAMQFGAAAAKQMQTAMRRNG